MLTQNNIVKRKGRYVILKDKKKKVRYFKGKFNSSYSQIQNIMPTTKKEYLSF